jgi:MoxR-like ATPase
MEERQISVDGETYAMGEPFMVMATQNPIESYGTFPLPGAQTDRFFMRLSLGYMTREEELSVIARRSTIEIVDSLPVVVTPEETAYLKENFIMSQSAQVSGYMLDIVDKRERKPFHHGVSTSGAIALYNASQVRRPFRRDYVLRRMCVLSRPMCSATDSPRRPYDKRTTPSPSCASCDQTPVPLETL